MKFLHTTLVGGFSLIALSSLTACDATFHDDLSDCRHTLWVTMANNDCAPVGAQPSRYVAPKGKVHLLAFDSKGVLAADTSWTQTEARVIERVPLHSFNQGAYTILGWTGIDEQKWAMQSLKLGKTRLTDVLLQQNAELNNDNQKPPMGNVPLKLIDLSNSQLWVGQNTAYLKLPNPADVGSTSQEVVLNMHEQTFHITAEIEVDPTTFDGKNDISAHDFDVRVTSQHPKLRMDGTPASTVEGESQDAIVRVNYARTDKLLTTTFTVPSLTSRNSKVRLELINRTNGKIVEQGTFDLLALLMLQQQFDPSCTRNAKLRFVLRDRCLDCGEFSCFSVWANGFKLGNFKDANR